jgi:HAD superfamily hydrolase (TIGR01490 family)
MELWRTRRTRVRDAASQAARASAASASTAEPRIPDPDPVAAAFFDVDNTIVRGASLFYLARGMYRRRMFRFRDILRSAWQELSFVVRGENLGHVADAQQRALELVAGRSVAELTALGEEIYDEVIRRKVWPGTRELARAHLAAGQRVWLVTATPAEVAEVIARRLGLTGALGTVAEQEDGVYTGRLVGEVLHGEAKARAVRALAEREGLDLAACAAYSDSANDLPLLSVVGRPVAVNPDKRLRAVARQRGWEIRDYRRGRRVARVGVPTLGAGGLVAGAATALARRRRARRLLTDKP